MKTLDALRDYPIYEKHPEYIKTYTEKDINDINTENILSGSITADDCKINSKTLEYQAQIQDSFGNPQVAGNFRRAAEMIKIPDKVILKIYNCLRPHVSTKQELLSIANEIEDKYGAAINAALIREAAQVYEIRNLLKKNVE